MNNDKNVGIKQLNLGICSTYTKWSSKALGGTNGFSTSDKKIENDEGEAATILF